MGGKGRGCAKNGFFSAENYYWTAKHYIVKQFSRDNSDKFTLQDEFCNSQVECNLE